MKKVFVFGEINPSKTNKKKGPKMAKKRKRGASSKKASHKKSHHGKRNGKRNPSGKRSRRRGKRNPSGIVSKAGRSAVDIVVKGLALGAGILGADVISQNLLPTSVRTSSARNAAKAAAAVVAGIGLSLVPISFVKKAALPVAIGGVGKAAYDQFAPDVLPKLEFNVLGESHYLGELDTRSLTLGNYDRRVITRQTLGEVPTNRMPFGLPG